MNKAQKLMVGFLAISVVIIVILFFLSQNTQKNYYTCQTNSLGQDITFYYSLTCSHCKNVEDFIVVNNISSKIKIIQKEVSQNQTNAQELLFLGDSCNIPRISKGAIPLLYVDKKVYLGDVDIIDFLKKEAGVK